ncbi:MAG: hypothetical protein JWM21_915 [Acidobacteria bacterium]|nr:hypothetical protein [Acidobacteriota bacterium]
MPTRKPATKRENYTSSRSQRYQCHCSPTAQSRLQPPHVLGIITDEGRLPDEPGIKYEKLANAPAKALRSRGPAAKHLDASAFRNALHAALKDDVAGYCMLLNKNGSPLKTTRVELG